MKMIINKAKWIAPLSIVVLSFACEDVDDLQSRVDLAQDLSHQQEFIDYQENSPDDSDSNLEQNHQTTTTSAQVGPVMPALKIDADEAFERGIGKVRAGNFKKALRYLSYATEQNPEHLNGWMQLARVQLKLKDNEGARKSVTQAMRIEEDKPQVLSLAGRVELNDGKYMAAIQLFRESIELDENHAPVHNALGLSLLAINENELALVQFEKSIELDPEIPYVHNNLGIAFMRLELTEPAKDEFEIALDLDPEAVNPKINLVRLAQIEQDDAINQALAQKTPPEDDPISSEIVEAIDPSPVTPLSLTEVETGHSR